MENQDVLESLSPDERTLLEYLETGTLERIKEKSKLDETKILRSLQYLENKGIVKLKSETKKIIDLDKNGVVYLKHGLPERRLLNTVTEVPEIELEKAKSKSKLSDNEFKVALGTLKSKALIELKDGKIILKASKEEIMKKSLEEQFLELLPIDESKLTPEQLYALDSLRSRKEIILVKDQRSVNIELTQLGKELVKEDISKFKDMIEALTPDMIMNETWKGRKFRKYDITSKVPEISGGKRHFVNQSIDYARKLWTELGFKEMQGTLVQTGFWNFDALFTAQDHPVRELQDTFYIKDIKGKLPDKELVEAVKKAHEGGIKGSKGWQYKWQEKEAERVILRTHTTCISAHTLASLKKLKDKTGKYFAIGKCFRNETVDWSHGFEFNQTEGIVVDKNANFGHLFGYLQEFYKKMGFEKVKFVPSYFPYTEPSVEIYVWHSERKTWLELGGAGMFRPEVVIALLGEYIPVLAWGPGFDRALMDYYAIKDLRELYSNNLTQLRKIKPWLK
jgi:phenylalanyl-tRNA synthetase alpha chain